jgi:hypothetical protein
MCHSLHDRSGEHWEGCGKPSIDLESSVAMLHDQAPDFSGSGRERGCESRLNDHITQQHRQHRIGVSQHASTLLT